MVRRLALATPAVALWAFASWQVAGSTYAAGATWPTHAATTVCVMVSIVLPFALAGGVALERRRQRRMFPPTVIVGPPVHRAITRVPAVTR